MKPFILILIVVTTMIACSHVYKSDPPSMVDITKIKVEPLSKTGNSPYEVYGKLYIPVDSVHNYTQTGIASWYGSKFHGKKTSSGEVYDMYGISAAHKTLPIPSYIKVTNLNNDKSILVRINDRGPFVGSRILDLSYGAAKQLGFLIQGTTRIKIQSINVNSKLKPDTPGQEKQVYLQVGVFSVYANALSAKESLEQKGYKVKIKKNKDKLYRIKVGPYINAELAFNEKKILERDGNSAVLLISESL